MSSTIVCTICHEGLCERPESLPAEVIDLVVAALPCGHIFHRFCIHQWFQCVQPGATDESEVECPCCQKKSQLQTALRLYPTTEEEDKEAGGTLLSRTQGAALLDELDESRCIIQQLSSTLDNETMNYTLLKSENERLEGDLKRLRREMEENEEMCKCIVESSNREIEKLKKENEKLKKEQNEAEKISGIRNKLELLKVVQEETKKILSVRMEMEKDALNQILVSLSNLDVDRGGSQNEPEKEEEAKEDRRITPAGNCSVVEIPQNDDAPSLEKEVELEVSDEDDVENILESIA